MILFNPLERLCWRYKKAINGTSFRLNNLSCGCLKHRKKTSGLVTGQIMRDLIRTIKQYNPSFLDLFCDECPLKVVWIRFLFVIRYLTLSEWNDVRLLTA